MRRGKIVPSYKEGRVYGQRKGKTAYLRGDEFYRQKLKAALEPEQNGQFVAIEPDSEQYFLGRTSSQAIALARAAVPGKEFFLARVGYPAAHTIRRLWLKQAA